MTITIFKDHDLKGNSQVVTGDIADLKDKPADKPGSIRLTADSEAVLLFKNDDWHGGALYIRGPKTVNDLGKADAGGRFGFGNSVRSLRTTPFFADLNVTVVKDAQGKLPGNWKTVDDAQQEIRAIVAQVNSFYVARRALLHLDIARIEMRTDAERFVISAGEQFMLPGSWTAKGEVDVVFTHRFQSEGTVGRGMFPCFGQSVVVAKVLNAVSGPDSALTTDTMAITLAHELGHHFGLAHGTASDHKANLMFPEVSVSSLQDSLLTPDQIREMHDRLANNLSRRNERATRQG